MRAFIAIEVSAEVRAAVGALVAELEGRVPKARWIPAENLHLTLRFLGTTDEKTLRGLVDELGAGVAACAPFRLEFRGIGFFPSPRRASVMSALISEPPRELTTLYRSVESTVGRHGFPPERRRFTPHLTFARLRAPSASLLTIQAELENRVLGHASVNEVIVFESLLEPSGAVYHAWARLPLGG
ncbi:MAG TPA: RNA 2',3'-cyclic phosphodiesterase [Vicinamibacteria bacterium]|jgi:2'-5' RNA ligase